MRTVCESNLLFCGPLARYRPPSRIRPGRSRSDHYYALPHYPYNPSLSFLLFPFRASSVVAGTLLAGVDASACPVFGSCASLFPAADADDDSLGRPSFAFRSAIWSFISWMSSARRAMVVGLRGIMVCLRITSHSYRLFGC